MVGLKLLTVACLIAAVYATPTFTKTVVKPADGVEKSVVKTGGGLGGLLGGLVNGVVNTAGNVVGNTLNTAGNIVSGVLGGDGNAQVGANVGLGAVFNPLIGALTGLTGNARSLLSDLANFKIPGTLDDVLNVLITVGASAGDIVDAILPGTGTALAQLVVGLLKILICVLGSPGLTGQLTGDRRPGYDNPNDIPAICGPNFGVKYGVKKYKGSCDNAEDVYNYYDLGDLDSQFRAALDKYTNGKGLKALNGSQKYIAEWILQLTGLVKKHPNGDFSEGDINTLATLYGWRIVIKIIGGLGNSYQTGLGDKIAIKLVKYFSSSTDGDGKITINLEAQLPAIKKAIDKCTPNKFGGAIKENNGNNNGNQPNSYVQLDDDNGQDTQTTNDSQNTQTTNDSQNTQTTNNQNTQTTNNQNTQTTNNQNTQTTNNQNTQTTNNQNTQTTNNQNTQTTNNQNTQTTNDSQNTQTNEQSNQSDDDSSDTSNFDDSNYDAANQETEQVYQYNSNGSTRSNSQNTQSGSEQNSEQTATNDQSNYEESGQQVIQNGDSTNSNSYKKSNSTANSNNSNKNSSSSFNNSSTTDDSTQYQTSGQITQKVGCQ